MGDTTFGDTGQRQQDASGIYNQESLLWTKDSYAAHVPATSLWAPAHRSRPLCSILCHGLIYCLGFGLHTSSKGTRNHD